MPLKEKDLKVRQELFGPCFIDFETVSYIQFLV